ncbi:hypothetical protein WG908_15940 [Sphingobium sp. AN641]|uniref:hypothetical protein n=1 Tax=Sphingobium sp. AN641 TaxID=3133443 RepID=UPI0030BF8A60
MRAPSLATAFFGHPVVATPLMLSGLVVLVLFLTQGQEGGLVLALPVAVMMVRLGKAVSAVSAYQAWKRAWDGMSPPRARRAVPWKPVFAVLFVTLVFANALAHPDRQSATAGAGMLVFALGLGLVAAIVRSLVRLWRGRLRRKVAHHNSVVTICARPIFPVPSLQHAYAALPDYCRQVLGR